MKDILVSVIIPVYNTQPYIEDCLMSVLAQTHQNLEVILINDGSTDESAKICAQFQADRRVRFINRENKGLSYTRQQGIDLATGSYFCNLDSDDILDLHFVEKMLQTALEEGADIVACARKDFDCGFERTYPLHAKQDFFALTKEIVGKRFHELHTQLWLADSWNKLYKTDFVRKTNVSYWLDNKYNGTDLSFNHLLVLHCPHIAVRNEPLLLHRIVLGSRVHRKNKPLQEGFQIITEKIFALANELSYDDSFFCSYRYCYHAYLQMSLCALLEESESQKEFLQHYRDFCHNRNSFAVQYPTLRAKKLKVKKGKRLTALLYSCITGNCLLRAAFLYQLNKIRAKRNAKRDF